MLVKLPILAEMLFEWEDTSLDICSNDVSIDVKVDPDEFALQKSNRSQVGEKKKKPSTEEAHSHLRASCLTNLEELSFLTVFALPKASRMGFACSSCFSSSP